VKHFYSSHTATDGLAIRWMVRFVLIRHAENEENKVMADVQLKMRRGAYSNRSEAMRDMIRRSTPCADGDLTSEGFAQARSLAAYYGPIFRKYMQTHGKVDIYTSPTLRTLRTTRELCIALGTQATVEPLMSETTGGLVDSRDREMHAEIVRKYKGERTKFRDVMARVRWRPCGLTGNQIEKMFPGTFKLDDSFPRSTPWCTYGVESLEQQIVRASQVVDFMRERCNTLGAKDLVILVAHGGIISMILSLLLSNAGSRRGIFKGIDNTSVTSVVLTRTEREGVISHDIAVEFVNRTDHLVSELGLNRVRGFYRFPGAANPATLEAHYESTREGPGNSDKTREGPSRTSRL